jgi:ribosomal-protein-alanine N-acetyltransferase
VARVLGLSALAGAMDLPELNTERLRLVIARRGLEAAHARFYSQNFAGHLDRWSPPMTGDRLDPAYWAMQLPIFEHEFEAGTTARWVMLATGDGPIEVIGTCNFTQIARGPFRACVLGYQIALQHQGRGLMQEALEATIGFAFRELRLHRIMANYRPENTRSGRLLERLGFVREGFAREYLFIDGAWRDHILTSRTNPDFDAAWLRA